MISDCSIYASGDVFNIFLIKITVVLRKNKHKHTFFFFFFYNVELDIEFFFEKMILFTDWFLV